MPLTTPLWPRHFELDVAAQAYIPALEPVGGRNVPDAIHSSVQFKDNEIVLRNRGTILSKESFEQGVVVEVTWKWTAGDDFLTIGLSTDGRQRGWAHDLYEGIVVRVNPAGKGIITIERLTDGENDSPELIASTKALSFPRDTPFKLRIVDDGTHITVIVDGKEVLKAAAKDRGKLSRVALFNREAVAGVQHESVLTDLTVGSRDR